MSVQAKGTEMDDRETLRDGGEDSRRELGLAGLVPHAWRLAEIEMREALDRDERRGLEASCAKGCSACCHYLVRLSIPEALYLGEMVMALGELRRRDVVARFASARDSIREAGLLKRLEADMIVPRGDTGADLRMHELARDYMKMTSGRGLECPFLVDDLCSIHTWRPATCRQYCVTSPAQLCLDPFGENVRRVPVSRNLTEAMANLAGELLGRPPEFIALPLALEWVGAHPEIASARWDERDLLGRL